MIVKFPARSLGLAAAVAALAAVTAACGGGSGGGTAAPPSAPAGQTHLTDSKGNTLYLFAPDHDGQSVCTGSCARYWPPVPAGTQLTGAAPGGTIGTVSRADGSKQESFDGHPLYTYVGDHAAGQATGQGLNVNGGLWWMVSPSGTAITTTGSAPSPSSGYNGGGY
ncbi:COG4315 family predicted lipoprotein [Amycolatopsis benzoatilytica]|uniref:COG4315 family predicted lipoprotein n=1 Tax=Amycolatopsis benzoatilytica TaxID=346045 RepID=UPI00036D048D|nr:hypothetical protein [Amycolatopsis benzoatilytica]